MKQCVVDSPIIGGSQPTPGAGLLLQNPQKTTGLWFGAPTVFSAPSGTGAGLRLIDPQGVSGQILGTPITYVSPPVPVTPPIVDSVVATGSTTLQVYWTDNQTAVPDSFNIVVTEVGVGQVQDNSVSGSIRSYGLTGLSAATQYDITMTTTVGAVTSGTSNTVRQTTDAASGAFSPDIMNMTFEGTTVGEHAGLNSTDYPLIRPYQSNLIYSDGRNQWEFSDEQVYSGTRSLKINVVDQVNSETNTVGGTTTLTTPYLLGDGDEFWWRARVYIPSDHNPSTIGSSDAKFFRIYRETATGDQRGGLEYKLAPSGGYRFENEWSSGVGLSSFNTTPATADEWTTGWQSFECYVKFSTVLGSGMVRFWRNNNLIYESNNIHTLPAGADRMWRTQFISYWNCAVRGQCSLTDAQNDAVPKTQGAFYIDNMYATGTNNPPINTDSGGNLFIGDYS